MLALLAGVLAACAQSVITLQHGAATTLFTVLDSAIVHAQSGDAIYLPGGPVASSASITITKKLSIFGAGYRADSSAATQPTTLAGTILFKPGAEGSLITGILAPNNDITLNCDNVSATRNLVNNIYIFGSGLFVEDNVVNTSVMGDGVTHINILIRKNVIYGYMEYIYNANLFNNVFLQNGASIQANVNCNFANNIFYISYSPTSFGNQGTFTNNLFTTDYNLPGNKVQAIGSIFTNYTVGAVWNLTQNFRLKAGCIGIKAGSDSTDVGIYGTSAPFKTSGLPFNPHIQSVSIPTATGPDGKLTISITVAAQNQ